MVLSIDHVFICVADLKGTENTLTQFGLRFGRHLRHRGQGTANACAFFDNSYLELLARVDDDELRSEAVRPLALWERTRWLHTGASPFGIAFRVENGGIPVETWPYEAPFLAAGGTIPIVTPRFAQHEPLVFLAPPPARAPATWPLDVRPPLEHCGKNRCLTAVTIYGPQLTDLSRGLSMLQHLQLFAVQSATEHRLILEWDNAVCGESRDFWPQLPLVLHW
jgi:hypothetical protein